MPEKDLKKLTLGIISDIHHWRDGEERLCSFGPYVREIDVWSRIFGKTIITAGKGQGAMPGHSLPYADQRIEFIPLYHITGASWTNRFKRILNIPSILISVIRTIRRSDVVHLRTPSFSCLIAMIVLLFSSRPRIAKWAGLFAPSKGDWFTARLQHLFLKAGWLRGPVMVYGAHKKPFLVPFFPAAITTTELNFLRANAWGKRFAPPWRILMVGRMVDWKGFDLGLQSLAHLKKHHPDISWQASMVGEGSHIETLKKLCRNLDLEMDVEFVGGKTFEQVLGYYATAHILLMPGQMEGFAKVLIEACASHTIPVATDIGLSPWILGYGKRGLLAHPDAASLGSTLERAISLSDIARTAMLEEGEEWADTLTLEKFKERLVSVLGVLISS